MYQALVLQFLIITNSMTQDDPPPTQVSILVNITADKGSVAIDGDLKFDYIVTNRE